MTQIDRRSWAERRDRQHENYVPDREERLGTMPNDVARGRGDGSLPILDLASGPGSFEAILSARRVSEGGADG